MPQTYLVNILLFCGIGLLLVLIVAGVQLIIVLIDIRRTTRETIKKFQAVFSAIDIVTLLLGGMGEVRKRVGKKLAPGSSTVVAFFAGLKKAIQVLLKK